MTNSAWFWQRLEEAQRSFDELPAWMKRDGMHRGLEAMNLAEIKAAAEKATPGKWTYNDNGYAITLVAADLTDPDGFPYVPLLDNIGDAAETHKQRVADAEFIALSREAVPWLVERVEELARALRRSLPIMERPVLAAEDKRDAIAAAAFARDALARLEGE